MAQKCVHLVEEKHDRNGCGLAIACRPSMDPHLPVCTAIAKAVGIQAGRRRGEVRLTIASIKRVRRALAIATPSRARATAMHATAASTCPPIYVRRDIYSADRSF